jgi:hypothetical protein
VHQVGFYLKDYTETHGQQNIKKMVKVILGDVVLDYAHNARFILGLFDF